MASRQMQRCSTSLIIRELKIKTTMQYHLTLVRIAIFKKSTNKKCWRGCREKKGNPPTLLVGMEIGTTTMENSMEVPQKTKYRTTI